MRFKAVVSSSVRLTGCVRLLIGVAIFLLAFLFMALIGSLIGEQQPSRRLSWIIVVFFLAGVIPFMQGVMELVTGVPFLKMSAAWMSLRGWQRLILGLIAVPIGVFIMLRIVGFALMSLLNMAGE